MDQARSASEVAKVVIGRSRELRQFDAQGEMLDLKITISSIVAQFRTLGREVDARTHKHRIRQDHLAKSNRVAEAQKADIAVSWLTYLSVMSKVQSSTFGVIYKLLGADEKHTPHQD